MNKQELYQEICRRRELYKGWSLKAQLMAISSKLIPQIEKHLLERKYHGQETKELK